MYKFFLLLLAIFLFGTEGDAQQMQWVPGDQVNDPDYADGTNCTQNILCYALAYTPSQTGVLTSYTTGFLVDCDNGRSTIVSNKSLVMTNNSAQQEACAEAGVLLLQSSGNTGAITVKNGRTTYLHEICLQTSGKTTEIHFEMDLLGGLTTSLDIHDRPALTERPEFTPFLFKRARAACLNTPNSVFSWDEAGIAEEPSEPHYGSFTLFPNPAVTEVQVRFDHVAEQVNFSLLDASGRELRSWKAATGTSHRVDVSKLPAGFYHLKASTEEETFTRKLIVRR